MGKICSKCGQEKDISIFVKNPTCKDGISNICRPCYALKKKKEKQDRAKRKKPIVDSISLEFLENNTRVCNECGEIKPLTKFIKRIDSLYGRGYKCSTCHNKHHRQIKGVYIIPNEKECRTCKTIKPIDEFTKDRKKSDCHSHFCKICERKYNREKGALKRKETKPILSEKHCKKCNTTKDISEFATNKNQKDGYMRYCKCCSKVIRRKHSKAAEARHTPIQKLKQRVKKSIRNAFNILEVRKTKTRAQLGIGMEFIFEGVGPQTNEDCELDHIIPIALFDYNIDSHVALSFHPNNLRWIPWKENLEKSDTIIWSLIEGDSVLEDIAKELGISKEDNGKRARDIKRDRGQNVNMEVFEDDLSDFDEEDEE